MDEVKGRYLFFIQNLPLPAIAEAIASAGGPAPPLIRQRADRLRWG